VYPVCSLACISLLVEQKAVSGVFIMSRLTSPARLDTRSAILATPCTAACPGRLLSPSLTSDGNSLMQLLHTVLHMHYPQHHIRNNSLLERIIYIPAVFCALCVTGYSDGTLGDMSELLSCAERYVVSHRSCCFCNLHKNALRDWVNYNNTSFLKEGKVVLFY